MEQDYYLIVKYTPICITTDIEPYNKSGYEIYRINADGSLTLVRYHWD